jgi:hypothetical protein
MKFFQIKRADSIEVVPASEIENGMLVIWERHYGEWHKNELVVEILREVELSIEILFQTWDRVSYRFTVETEGKSYSNEGVCFSFDLAHDITEQEVINLILKDIDLYAIVLQM